MEELEHSITVKIAKEAVMNINSPRNLFKPSSGFLETKVYIAGLPRKVDNTLIKAVIFFSVDYSISSATSSLILAYICSFVTTV